MVWASLFVSHRVLLVSGPASCSWSTMCCLSLRTISLSRHYPTLLANFPSPLGVRNSILCCVGGRVVVVHYCLFSKFSILLGFCPWATIFHPVRDASLASWPLCNCIITWNHFLSWFNTWRYYLCGSVSLWFEAIKLSISLLNVSKAIFLGKQLPWISDSCI